MQMSQLGERCNFASWSNVGDDVEVEEEAIRIENFSTIMLYNSCVHQISSVMTSMIDFWISTK